MITQRTAMAVGPRNRGLPSPPTLSQRARKDGAPTVYYFGGMDGPPSGQGCPLHTGIPILGIASTFLLQFLAFNFPRNSNRSIRRHWRFFGGWLVLRRSTRDPHSTRSLRSLAQGRLSPRSLCEPPTEVGGLPEDAGLRDDAVGGACAGSMETEIIGAGAGR